MQPFPADQPEFTFMAAEIVAPGQAVEILSVRVLTTPNVTYLGALTVWPRNPRSAPATGIGFPHLGARDVHPAFGVVIPPEETGFIFPGERESRAITVEGGYRLSGAGPGAVNVAEVAYRADGEIHRVKSDTAIIVCLIPCLDKKRYPDTFEWDRVIRDRLGVVESDTPAEPGRTAKPTAVPSAQARRTGSGRRWHSG